VTSLSIRKIRVKNITKGRQDKGRSRLKKEGHLRRGFNYLGKSESLLAIRIDRGRSPGLLRTHGGGRAWGKGTQVREKRQG